MQSANKNSSALGLPMTDHKQAANQRNNTIDQFQTQQGVQPNSTVNQQQMMLGPNQQFSFPGTQLLGGTQVIGHQMMTPGQQHPSNMTQPFDMSAMVMNN